MNTRKRYQFFKANAGYVVGRRAESALELARAEAKALQLSWRADWEAEGLCDCAPGNEESGCDGNDCQQVLLLDANNNVLGSLGCICEPSAAYRRVVEAELASGALADKRRLDRIWAE